MTELEPSHHAPEPGPEAHAHAVVGLHQLVAVVLEVEAREDAPGHRRRDGEGPALPGAGQRDGDAVAEVDQADPASPVAAADVHGGQPGMGLQGRGQGGRERDCTVAAGLGSCRSAGCQEEDEGHGRGRRDARRPRRRRAHASCGRSLMMAMRCPSGSRKKAIHSSRSPRSATLWGGLSKGTSRSRRRAWAASRSSTLK